MPTILDDEDEFVGIDVSILVGGVNVTVVVFAAKFGEIVGDVVTGVEITHL